MRRDASPLVTIAMFHSMFGLRNVERTAAERLRAAGHHVVTPDLFAGAVAGQGRRPTLEDGFAVMERIGWDTIMQRAHLAITNLPPATVLCGCSMGVGVVGSLWPERLDTASIVLFHATAAMPDDVRHGTPVQAHAALGDPFAPEDQLAVFRHTAATGADATLHTYAGSGHMFTDQELPDYNHSAAESAWQHVNDLLEMLRQSPRD
jgi:dienelactone hydrolase